MGKSTVSFLSTLRVSLIRLTLKRTLVTGISGVLDATGSGANEQLSLPPFKLFKKFNGSVLKFSMYWFLVGSEFALNFTELRTEKEKSK